MSSSVSLIWEPELRKYDFGEGHPLTPARVQLAWFLTQAFGLDKLPHVDVITPVEPASMDDLLRVHTPEFIEAVQAASTVDAVPDLRWGLGTGDVPLFHGMHDAAALVAGATQSAAARVWQGHSQHAVNIGGGLHHAMPDTASGFCVYNDLAVAITWLLDNGAQRVAYIDVDVHHGDGVQACFENDPRVLTVSIHEGPRTLFPGTGFAHETGGPDASGTAVNIALPMRTTDAKWLRAFHAVVPQVVREFAPDVIVSQHGCDSHMTDPLANLLLSIEGQRASYQAIHALAHELCDGKWIATGGGGYETIGVVPRAWTHLIAEAVGEPIDPRAQVPQDYLDFVHRMLAKSAPPTMGDGMDVEFLAWDGHHDPDDFVDRAIIETLQAHGLESYPYGGL